MNKNHKYKVGDRVVYSVPNGSNWRTEYGDISYLDIYDGTYTIKPSDGSRDDCDVPEFAIRKETYEDS